MDKKSRLEESIALSNDKAGDNDALIAATPELPTYHTLMYENSNGAKSHLLSTLSTQLKMNMIVLHLSSMISIDCKL